MTSQFWSRTLTLLVKLQQRHLAKKVLLQQIQSLLNYCLTGSKSNILNVESMHVQIKVHRNLSTAITLLQANKQAWKKSYTNSCLVLSLRLQRDVHWNKSSKVNQLNKMQNSYSLTLHLHLSLVTHPTKSKRSYLLVGRRLNRIWFHWCRRLYSYISSCSSSRFLVFHDLPWYTWQQQLDSRAEVWTGPNSQDQESERASRV